VLVLLWRDMDPFDWFSLAGKLFPRLVKTVIVIGVLAFPVTAKSVFIWMVRETAAEKTSELRSALRPTFARVKHRDRVSEPVVGHR
jgi:hypothetical protein